VSVREPLAVLGLHEEEVHPRLLEAEIVTWKPS
jgi:hypothetical protein